MTHRWLLALALAGAVWGVDAQPASSPVAIAAGTEAATSAADPVLEARVMKVAEELRCLVCQNETIAASHADLAVDLRKQIRTKLGEGQSERQILDFMVERYGDFVLYRPALKATTVLLWVGPFLLLLIAGYALARAIRGRQRQAAVPLSSTDAARARKLLDESPSGS
jgi:cytochrome c-type biogenesis protein CcmH